MAVLTNKSIASTYKSVLSIGATTESALTTSIQQLTDGLGNSSPLSMSTTQIQFNNDANTFSFPATRGTSGQILKLADANGTLSWADDDLSNTLDFSGGTGTGSVTLDTQTLAFTGTANQIETSASSQAITLSFPTAGVTLPDGSIATTQTASDDSTKVATTAYVEAAVAAGGVGNVTKTGTPSTNEVAIWTNSNTIKGDASFTMSSSTFQINNSTASSQSNLIISNNDTAINSIPANIIFNSNTLTSYKTLAQIYATKTDADIANASGKLNFSTTDAGVPSVKFIINSNGLSEFFGNVNAYNTSSLKLYSLGQEGYSNTEFLEIKKSSTNAIFNVNKVGTGSVRGLEFQTGGSPKLTISSGGNVGIGTDDPNAKLEIFGIGNSLRLDSAANQSKEILLRNVGTGIASIKTDGDLKLDAEDAGKNILFNTAGSERIRILSTGVINSYYGIAFPNQSAGSGTPTSGGEILDAYEEGTWTPTFVGCNFTGTVEAKYTRIGREVYISLHFINQTISSSTGTGGGFSNLPFSKGGAVAYHPISLTNTDSLSSPSSGFIRAHNGTINLNIGSSTTDASWINGTNNRSMMLSGTYTI